MTGRFLCAMACYDAAGEALLGGWQQRLYDAGFKGEQSRDIPQHITLGTFPVDAVERAVSAVRTAAAMAPFAVSISHMGMFAGGRVLFAAPDVNRELLTLRERFGDSAGWVPHSTMLIDRPDEVERALPVLRECFAPALVTVSAIELYEFWPARFICRVPLG